MKTLIAIVLFICMSFYCVVADDYGVILDSYGNLQLIAGTGQRQDTNGWQQSMEGSNALDVELSNTHQTMADSQKNLYLVDKESHSVLKMTPEGTIHTVAGTHVAGDGGDAAQVGTNVALSNPNGLYVLPEGTVYILDMDNAKIRKLNTNGIVSTVVSDPIPILLGRGLWVSSDETLIYYCSYHLDGNAGVVRKWTTTGGLSTYATNFVQLGNIDVDPTDGNLVVTDRGAHQVYRVFPDGSREVIAGDGTTQNHGDGGPATNAGLDEVRGIAFLPHGGYFLATQGDGDIWYVDTNHIAHEFIQGSGSSTPLPHDEICEPRAVSIAPWGDLIITENDYAVVRIVPRTLAISDVATAATNGFRLMWYSMPSWTYDVECTEDLIATNWQTLVTKTGDSNNILSIHTDTNSTYEDKMFYRIRTD